MPVFGLSDEMIFPHPGLAEPDGLLAMGGDLLPKRLLLAYSMGIFPWYNEDSPILWWSPDPRLVLFPNELTVSRSLRQTMKKGIYTVTYNQAFEQVIKNCARVHVEKEGGTWITKDMVEAYIKLHSLGFAHSAESWHKGELKGGLYGVAIGSVFFGESMFSTSKDASKAAFVSLVQERLNDFSVIDCQVDSAHMRSFGAREIPRRKFTGILNEAMAIGAGRVSARKL